MRSDAAGFWLKRRGFAVSKSLRYSRLAYWAKLLGVAAAYFAAGKLGTLLAVPPGYATAIWAPSGIALAGILLFGYRVWPGVWLGSCLVNFATTLHAIPSPSIAEASWVVACIAAGASLEALLGAFLIRRIIGFPNPLNDARHIALFLLLGGPVSCLAAATIGVTTLSFAGAIPWHDYSLNWWTWWVGDAMGVIIVAPLILIAIPERGLIWSRRQISVIVPLCLTFFLVIVLVTFSNGRERTMTKLQFERQAKFLSDTLKNSFHGSMGLLLSAKTFLENSTEVEREAFHHFAVSTLLSHPELEVSMLAEQKSRSKIVIVQAEPASGNGNSAGMNLAVNPVVRRAMAKARDTDEPTAVPTDNLFPEHAKRPRIVVCVPIYRNQIQFKSLADRRENLQGYILGVFRIDKIVESSLDGLLGNGINLRISDQEGRSGHSILYETRASVQPGAGSQNPRDVVGVEWDSPFNFADQPLALTLFETQDYLISHQSWHVWLVLASGLVFTALLGAFLLVVTGSAANVEKLVEQRTASLEASESRLRSVMQTANDAIITANGRREITAANEAALAAFGYASEQELIGKPFNRLMSDKAELSDFIGKMTERAGVKKDGNRFPMELSLSTFRAGDDVFYTGIIRDITERKRIERAKTDLVSFASHQLKTPLAAIKGMAENVLRGLAGDLTDKQREYLNLIQQSSEKNLGLIMDLLNVSKLEAGTISTELKDVKLCDIIDSLAKDYGPAIEKKGLRLNVEKADSGLTVHADVQKTAESLKNVLENAIRFTETGSITLRIRSQSAFGIVEIEDTGPGIDKKIMDKLFTKELILSGAAGESGEGTGLGLYIAKSFMQLQGGDVSVLSTSGKGARFIFKIPRPALSH